MAYIQDLPAIGRDGFLGVVESMIPRRKLEKLCARHTAAVARKRKFTTAELLNALIFHQVQAAGTLGEHARELYSRRMSESAHSQRRQALPQELFTQVMAAALKPLANEQDHPASFYAERRLVGVDGTQFSVTNTAAIAKRLPKAATRRFKAAFAKVRVVTLAELGVHNPLAAAVGPASTGEQKLAAQVWVHVPDKALLLLDRLFGSPLTLWQAKQEWGSRDVAVLARVKEQVKAKVLKKLSDGSVLVEVPVMQNRRKVDVLVMREIRAEGTSLDGRRFQLRLWTTLLDPKAHPAETLARLYAERWEHELYYNLLKLDVRGSDVLASHTYETAMQEIAALILATAVVARVRVAAAQSLQVPPTRVSFLKVLLPTLKLWSAFAWAQGALTPAVRRKLLKSYYEEVSASALLPPRRDRSCPRVVRRTTTAWPRKINQPSFKGRVRVSCVRST